ncbi:hypothetical protein T02_1977 [Trichinella nativa]|uniref:Uncharacterized protein n=1 Tax=Trichinella nativa TaxID=6335 RepID=A0A0V1L2B9_9BILA|nr:hypothetical protein T02_1977 [Trichinella nativa]
MLPRACLLCAEHSAPSTRAHLHASRSPSHPSSLLTWHFIRKRRYPGASDAGARGLVDSRTILTLQPSVMKFVPEIPGTTRFSTTVKCICPLQFPSWSDHIPWPQRRTLRLTSSRMEPLAAPKGSPPVALHQADIVIVWLGIPSSPGDSGPWFCCSEYSPARFGHVTGDSSVECGPDHRSRSIPLPFERDASGTAYLVSPLACPTVGPELVQPSEKSTRISLQQNMRYRATQYEQEKTVH